LRDPFEPLFPFGYRVGPSQSQPGLQGTFTPTQQDNSLRRYDPVEQVFYFGDRLRKEIERIAPGSLCQFRSLSPDYPDAAFLGYRWRWSFMVREAFSIVPAKLNSGADKLAAVCMWHRSA
jgi:hypothetical protein